MISAGAWVASPIDAYRIGGIVYAPDLVRNSAGGVAVTCDEQVWASGDALHFPYPYLYGLTLIPAGGNPPIAPTGSDLVQGARLKVLNEQDARIALETLVARVQRGESFRRNRRGCHRRQSSVL